MSNVKIKYTVKDDMSAITATLPAGYSFGEAPAPDFYLIGNFNNWTLADAACKMTPQRECLHHHRCRRHHRGCW